MIKFIKKNVFLILIFILTLSIGFLTFLTFIDKSFIKLTDFNLQILLVLNIVLLFIFFLIIYVEIQNVLKSYIYVKGSLANKKYITFFSLFTLIPSVLISIFSLFLFSFALEKYLDNKITTAVNNSYELAKNYVDEIKNQIETDIILVAFDLNKYINIYYNNPSRYKNILNTQKIVRDLDEIHLIDSSGNLIVSTNSKDQIFNPPDDKALEMVFGEERPLKLINAYEDQTSAIIKLDGYIDTYLYVVKLLDKEISNVLKESEEAINFYYIVEEKRTGIKISFALIYLVVVALMLFLSITIAIRFSSRFFLSINNLIGASLKVGKGNLNIKVPTIKTGDEIEILNKNFNIMIEQLKSQQEKLLLTERHEAWENVARKIAHEIKNPLTPIQLTIDRIKSKYLDSISEKEKNNFNNYLQVVIKQIKQIESLVNEFSDFARMPKPVFQSSNLVEIINTNINLLKEFDKSIKINFNYAKSDCVINCDYEQISRVFFNLIKNSIESIQEKFTKKVDFSKFIDIEMFNKNAYISISIIDNGIGISEKNIKNLTKPYYSTKSKGSGLGLSIVTKIINDHNGSIKFKSIKNGAKITLILPKNKNVS